MRITELAAAERADLAAFLSTLSPAQWETPTLCDDWSVRDVVAHMISYEDLGLAGGLRRVAEERFSLDRANKIGVAERRTQGPPELLDQLTHRLVPRGLPAQFGGRIALADALIHHQDIRRPLGCPRVVPPERLSVALSFALVAPPIGGFWMVRGLRLEASDQDWAGGRGRLVRGRAEALLMAVAGRRGVVEELSGPGQEVLAGRIGG
ncbi:MAG TPA: maleylpyruvate isomerase family mycothiol-dependent enzyme [Pseudonocardia sp.]